MSEAWCDWFYRVLWYSEVYTLEEAMEFAR